MKNALLLILSVLWILGCKKDEPVSPPPTVVEPPVTVKDSSFLLINEVRWPIQLKALYNGSVGDKKLIFIYGKRFITNLNVEETLSIRYIYPEKGIYQYHYPNDTSGVLFKSPKILMGWVLDLDQAIGAARIDTTQSGSYLEIIRYDSVQHIVEGRFEAYLKVPDPFPSPYYPVESHITQGYFLLNIKQ